MASRLKQEVLLAGQECVICQGSPPCVMKLKTNGFFLRNVIHCSLHKVLFFSHPKELQQTPTLYHKLPLEAKSCYTISHTLEKIGFSYVILFTDFGCL